MEDTILLPFCEEPLSIAYQYSAFALGIIQGNATANIVPWLCTKYFDCTFRKNYSHKFSISTYDHWAVDEKILINEKVSLEIKTYNQLNIDIIQLLKKILKDQKYVYGHYNEKFIPGKKAFEKKYRHHDYLLIGYNDLKRVFYSVGYLDDAKFQKFEIPYKNMREALLTLDVPTLSIDIFSFNSDFNFTCDIEKVKLMLKNYLNSRASFSEEINGHFYGVKAIEELAIYIKNIFVYTNEYKIKYLRALFEHKNIMYIRIKYLYENGYIKNKNCVEQANLVCDLAKKVHLLGIKYIFSKGNETLNCLCERILKLNEIEQNYLRKVLAELE